MEATQSNSPGSDHHVSALTVVIRRRPHHLQHRHARDHDHQLNIRQKLPEITITS